MRCGKRGRISTEAGNSGSTLPIKGIRTAGKNLVPAVTTAPSWFRFPGRASSRAYINPKGAPQVAWYRRQFAIPKEFPADQHVWLRFGAIDWRADVWVNGQKVAEHEGGYTPFEADISGAAKRESSKHPGRSRIRSDRSQAPDGKQVGWYTPSSGIWQTAWLEARPASFITDFKMTPTIDPPAVAFRVTASGLPKEPEFQVSVDARDFEGGPKLSTSRTERSRDGAANFEFSLPVPDAKLWTPERPISMTSY